MAKANITQYSSTPSSNTDINNINIDENCPASGLNNAIRELMAHLKNVDTGSQALTALSVTGDLTVDTNTLFVDSANNRVGIGTTSPNTALQVEKDWVSDYGSINISHSTNSLGGLGIRCNGVFKSALIYKGGTSGALLDIGTYNAEPILFRTNNSEAMRIDSSGNLLVGTTDTAPTADGETGFVARASGYVIAGMNNQQVMLLNRSGTDGDILQFRKSGSAVGSIASRAGSVSTIILDPSATGGGISGGGAALYPTDHAGTLSDGALTLGDASYRWNNLYLSGGVYLGGTGSANYLDDYEEGTWTPTYTGASGNPTVTYQSQVGSYVKVGKFVFLSFSMSTTSVSGGSSSSDLRVSGLPFTCGSQSGDRGALSSVRTQNWVSNVRSPVGGYINANTNYINLNSYDSGAYSTATLCDTDDLRTTGDSNQLTATVTYITA